MFVNNIKKLCTKMNVSISQLETETKIGKKTIYRWDKVSPSIDKIKRVADYFGVTVDELLKPTD